MREITTNDVFEAFERAQKAFYECRMRNIRTIREEFTKYYYEKNLEEETIED